MIEYVNPLMNSSPLSNIGYMSQDKYLQELNYRTPVKTVQARFILDVPGANLSSEHEIFKIKNTYHDI